MEGQIEWIAAIHRNKQRIFRNVQILKDTKIYYERRFFSGYNENQGITLG